VPFAFLVFGAVFGLLFLVSTLVRTLRASEKIGFLENLLAFLTALLPLARWMIVYLNANFVTERPPRPTKTPTPTRARFAMPTPPPTATLPNPCLAIVNYNLRLRAQPDANAETLLIIPYNTIITLYGGTEDSAWWYALYQNQTGWVKGEYLNLSASWNDLPVHNHE
jgi:SH3 domain-containing protein